MGKTSSEFHHWFGEPETSEEVTGCNPTRLLDDDAAVAAAPPPPLFIFASSALILAFLFEL